MLVVIMKGWGFIRERDYILNLRRRDVNQELVLKGWLKTYKKRKWEMNNLKRDKLAELVQEELRNVCNS